MHELGRLLFASVFTLSLSTLATSSRGDEPKVGVAGAVNPATHATPDGGQTAILTIGNDVSFNEVITTDAEGQAQLLFLDRSALTVGPNARLTIDEFVYNPNTKEGKLAINAAVGVFRFVGGQLSKSGDVTLKTPVATIGIRGAVALVTVTPTSVSASLLFGNGLTITPNTQLQPGGGPTGGGQQGGGQQGGGQQGGGQQGGGRAGGGRRGGGQRGGGRQGGGRQGGGEQRGGNQEAGGQQGGGQQGGGQQGGGTAGGGTTGGAPSGGGGGGGGGTITLTAG